MPSRRAEIETFLRLTEPRIYAYVCRLHGPRDAEDLTQEALLRAWRAWPDALDPAQARPWLFKIALNLCRDHARRFSRRPAIEPLAEEFAPAAPSPDPAQAELVRIVREAVETLPEPQRHVFHLREDAGLSFREIADVLGCPLNTALGRMHDALEKIRKLVRVEVP